MQTNLASSINHSRSSFYNALGPLLLPATMYLIGFIILTSFRGLLTITYWERLAETPQVLMLFPVGLRMDLLLLTYFTIAPAILLLLLPKSIVAKRKTWFILWAVISLSAILYMEVATFPFLEEYDLRPDRKFFEYLQHPNEVMGTLWKAYKAQLIFGTLVLIGSCLGFWKIFSRVIKNYTPWKLNKRLIAFPIVTALLVLAARSSIGHRPANLSTAAFSNNHLANEIALNSAYTVLYAGYRALKHEKNPSRMYGKFDEAQVIERIQPLITQPNQEAIAGEIPFLHKQKSPFKTDRPYNIVIFLQESLGAVDVGCLEGPAITPNLCRLKAEGLWFSNLYATGTRTVRGIEAVVSGFLPTANAGVVKLGLAKKGFFTAADLLKRHGYETDFIYGGMSNFDEMRSFFLGNGFTNIYDEPTFKNPVFASTWGVSDEDLVRKANQIFTAHGDKPFFSLILSTSNHVPYEFPDGRIELYEQPKQTHQNAVKYADYAIGLLFELAKQKDYFKNTIFLIVADHNSHVRGNDLVPIDKFHIPGLIIGPNVPKENFKLLSSQIDLLPTLLHFSGLETIHPMIGRNLMQLAPETKGRAIMQYASNAAYRVEDQVVMLRPFEEPIQFELQEGELQPTELDPELAEDALANAYLPWFLYSKQLYRLPN
ncbi:MAG: LTA synthase family protein [Bdellovibrionota bacterium]